MKSLPAFLSLSLALSSSVVLAQHAKDDWPTPIKPYYTGQLMLDRLEISQNDKGDNVATWDMLAWYGSDETRIYFKSEGENQLNDGEPSELERAEVLASKLILPFWEAQAGLGARGSLDSDVNLEHYAVFSLFGLAPYRFEMDNSLTVNEDGDVAAKIEAEYDLRLTQASYLQPRLALAAALTDALDYNRPRGLNSVRVGLRYRYEFTREFAPYIGAYWRSSFGETADLEEAQGKDDSEFGLVIGVRMWF
jgi:copper resistance protein B